MKRLTCNRYRQSLPLMLFTLCALFLLAPVVSRAQQQLISPDPIPPVQMTGCCVEDLGGDATSNYYQLITALNSAISSGSTHFCLGVKFTGEALEADALELDGALTLQIDDGNFIYFLPPGGIYNTASALEPYMGDGLAISRAADGSGFGGWLVGGGIPLGATPDWASDVDGCTRGVVEYDITAFSQGIGNNPPIGTIPDSGQVWADPLPGGRRSKRSV